MKQKTGYKSIPLSFNRLAVIASASVTKEKNAIHSITEVDITVPRRLIKEYSTRTGVKLSFTSYIVKCMAQTMVDHPLLNSFIKGRKQIILEDVTVTVLIERELNGEKVPEPFAIKNAQLKTCSQITTEIRAAREHSGEKLGNLSNMTWIRLIPGFLLKFFVRLADSNINLAKKYGKVAVTAIGMFDKERIWFIPHGTATVLLTVGGMYQKTEVNGDTVVENEYLCLTASFDHNIVDGAPAARFMKQLTDTIKAGELIIFPGV